MWIILALIAAAAVYVVSERTVFGWLPAYDLYAYFYPKALYALESLRDGGKGLLWNPYQNCGQPFFALSQTGLLYPPYALFLILGPEEGLRGVLILHLVIGGIGTYLLGRELGAGRTSALLGAMTFELGNSMLRLTISSPTHCAPYAWLPMAMWCCERLLRVPRFERAVALASVLAVMLLTGMPQIVFFAYQLLGLRLLWELATRRGEAWTRQLTWLLFAALLPVALAAVQFFPELEAAFESIRSTSLTPRELSPYEGWGLRDLLADLAGRSARQPFLLVPCIIGMATFFDARLRRRGTYYAVAGGLAVALAFGKGSPIYDLYSYFPGSQLFRQTARFLWITSFCLAPLAALGCESLAAAKPSIDLRRRVLAVAAILTPLFLLRALSGGGLQVNEWIAALCAAAIAALAFSSRRRHPWLPPALLAALFVQLYWAAPFAGMYLYPSAPDYRAHATQLDALRTRVDATSRLYLVAPHAFKNAFTFIDKTASILRLPAVLDYEPLVARRFAELTVRMLSGRPMRSINEAIYRAARLSPTVSRRLLDLSTARYLVVAPPLLASAEAMQPPLRRLDIPGDLAVFENPQALPRAFFVPRVVVLPEAPALLRRLVEGSDDLRRVALVETGPPSGFAGEDNTGDALATVRWRRNDPEDLAVEVDAPQRGFLVLLDQYFPGWEATVDGHPAPIQRANHAFRLLEVPAGSSLVEMHYRPGSLRLGAITSLTTVLAVAALLLARRRRPATQVAEGEVAAAGA